jgi:hypothetical protein
VGKQRFQHTTKSLAQLFVPMIVMPQDVYLLLSMIKVKGRLAL